MTKISMMTMVAGAALSSGMALAQNAGLDQNRAYAAEMVADASGRTSLLQPGSGGAGRDAGGMFISDSNGDNKLYLGGDARFFWHSSFRSDNSGPDNDFTQGFQNTLTRVRASGNIWSKELTFKIQANFSEDGGFALSDAWGRYTWDNGFYAQWGQFKAPLLRETLVDDQFQLAANRSEVTQLFGQDYSQGIMVGYGQEQWRFMAAFTDGFQSALVPSTRNTPFNSAAEADWALSGRVEVRFGDGDFSQFNDFTSFQGKQGVGFLLGGAIGYQSFGDTGPGAADATDWVYTIDFSVEGNGWNIFAAFVGANNDPDGPGDSSNYGGIIQGGIFVDPQWELFARWDGIFLDNVDAFAPGADEDLHFISLGANYYLSPESHAAKFTGQLIWSLSDTSALGAAGFLPDTATGILGDTDSGEIDLAFGATLVF